MNQGGRPVGGKWQNLYQSVLKSTLYLSGNTFTCHDIAFRHKVKPQQATKVLMELIKDGYLNGYGNGGQDFKNYIRRARHSDLGKRKLSNYTPPIQPNELTASTRFIYGGRING